MSRLLLTRPAVQDIDRILAYSANRFGEDRADRYHSLILKALRLLERDPDNRSVRRVVGARPDIRLFFLRSVPQGRPKIVGRPRHAILFRTEADRVRILRLVHERMALEKHLR